MSDPITTWNITTINGKSFLVVDVASFRIPLDWDPSSNMFIAVAAPIGGLGNFPALLKGDPGDVPTFDTTVNATFLEYTDPTADSITLTALGGNEYQLNVVTHKGPPGDPGTAELDPTAFGTPVSKKILIVNPTADGFVYQAQLVGDRFLPASINSTPAGNPLYTLAAVSVPAQQFDWRPEVSGQTIITGSGGFFGSNVKVDLIARLNDEAAGNIVGRAFGVSQTSPEPAVLVAGPPAGSVDAYDRVSAGSAVVVYLRAERQSGTDTFTTAATTTSFQVRVAPIPGTGT